MLVITPLRYLMEKSKEIEDKPESKQTVLKKMLLSQRTNCAGPIFKLDQELTVTELTKQSFTNQDDQKKLLPFTASCA